MNLIGSETVEGKDEITLVFDVQNGFRQCGVTAKIERRLFDKAQEMRLFREVLQPALASMRERLNRP